MLIVETGAGLPTAESYATVDEFNQYHTDRQNAFTLSGLQIEAALRKATEYIEQVYTGRWAGYRNKDTQALDWPRSYVPREASVGYPTGGNYTPEGEGYYPFNVLPVQLKQATIILALKSVDADLLPDFDRLPKRETVGQLTVEYAENKSPVVTYPAIDRLLSRFFKDVNAGSIGGASVVKLSRA